MTSTPPWWMASIGYALQWVVALLAHRHSKKAPFHKPASYYIWWVAVVDFLRIFLEATRPHRGVLFILDELSFLSLPSGLSYIVARVCIKTRCKWVGIAILAIAFTITITYPKSAAFWVYLAVQIASVGIAWILLLQAFHKGRVWMGLTELTLLCYLVTETAVLVGPFLNEFFTSWKTVWTLMFGLNLSVLALHIMWNASTKAKPLTYD